MSEIASEVTSSNQPEGNTQPDSVGSFSFAGLHEKALAAMEPSNTPAEPVAPASTTPVATEPAEHVAPPSTDAQNVDGATAAQLASLKDTDLVEVTVDGKPMQMPWAEAKGGVMRQAHYTKSMQQLAREREALEAQRPQIEQISKEREALLTVLSDENMLRQVLQAKYPHLLAQAKAEAAAAAGVPDPDDIATVGQVEAVARQYAENVQNLVQQLQGQLQSKASEITRQIEDRQATLKLSTDINSTIASLKSTAPHIEKVVPNFEQVLRYNVAQMNPQTPEETLEAFRTVFGGMVENFNAAVADTTKSQVINKQKLVDNNIQSSRGADVMPQPSTPFKTNAITGKRDVDWDKLREQASSMLS